MADSPKRVFFKSLSTVDAKSVLHGHVHTQTHTQCDNEVPIGDERHYIQRTVTYMMCKFQFVWLMYMRITTVLVKLVFLSCLRFQNYTKSSDEVFFVKLSIH
jgi:hypothetical protein